MFRLTTSLLSSFLLFGTNNGQSEGCNAIIYTTFSSFEISYGLVDTCIKQKKDSDDAESYEITCNDDALTATMSTYSGTSCSGTAVSETTIESGTVGFNLTTVVCTADDACPGTVLYLYVGSEDACDDNDNLFRSIQTVTDLCLSDGEMYYKVSCSGSTITEKEYALTDTSCDTLINETSITVSDFTTNITCAEIECFGSGGTIITTTSYETGDTNNTNNSNETKSDSNEDSATNMFLTFNVLALLTLTTILL